MSVDPVGSIDSLQRIRELEKSLRILKQEKEEAQKVSFVMNFNKL